MVCYEILKKYFARKSVLHIAGGFNTGKSLLVKDIIKNTLCPLNPGSSIYYLDADKKFPKRAYQSTFSKQILKERIFVRKIFNSADFAKTLTSLAGERSTLQEGDIVIIDSVSEFVKQNLSHVDDYAEWKAEVEYLKTVIIPLLIRLIIRKKVKLILVHHISYNPAVDHEVPFYHDVFRMINGMWMFLTKDQNRPHGHQEEFQLFLSIENKVEDHGIIVNKTFERMYPYCIKAGAIIF